MTGANGLFYMVKSKIGTVSPFKHNVDKKSNCQRYHQKIETPLSKHKKPRFLITMFILFRKILILEGKDLKIV